MSLSLLQESSLDTEFALLHIRHQNAFLSHLCCYCEDVGFSSSVEGAPNFKMGASGDQEIPIWVVVAEQGDCVSREWWKWGSWKSLAPLPAGRWWKLQHPGFEAIDTGDLTSSLAWFEAFLPTLFEFGCPCFWWLCELLNILIVNSLSASNQPELISVAATNNPNWKRVM